MVVNVGTRKGGGGRRLGTGLLKVLTWQNLQRDARYSSMWCDMFPSSIPTEPLAINTSTPMCLTQLHTVVATWTPPVGASEDGMWQGIEMEGSTF